MNQPVSSTSSVTSLPTATSGPSASSANGNASGTGSGTILLPHPPPSLSALTEGQLIRAVVIGPTADGKTILETIYGKFALPLPDSPSPGSVLQLQIAKPGIPVELIVVGSDARGAALPSSSIIRVAQPPSGLLTLMNGELFRGVVVNSLADGRTVVDTRYGQLSLQLPHQAAKGSALEFQIVKSGDPLELRLVTLGASKTGATAAGGKATSPAAFAAGETISGRFDPSAGGAAAASAGSGARLAAGGFHAKVVAIHTNAPATAMAGDDAVVTGRIISSQAGGPTVIETASGRIVVPTAGGAIADRYVTLRILAEPGTVLPTNPGATPLRSLLSFSGNWPALKDVIDAVNTTNPQTAAQFTATAIPNTGITLTAGIALFLAVLTRGQMPDWLGADVMRLLESTNRQTLLNQLGDDFSQIVRAAGEAANSEWRVAMLPLLHDGALHQLRLYLRERDGGGQSAGEAAGTRFIIEASLSHLGNIQLDGLVRKGRFDLMVRTQRAFPPEMQEEIAELFAKANEEFNVQGQINFQVQSHFAVDPVEQLSDHAVGVYA